MHSGLLFSSVTPQRHDGPVLQLDHGAGVWLAGGLRTRSVRQLGTSVGDQWADPPLRHAAGI